MIIGDRLRELRESKELSQGDVEKKTGLLRCYVSRVENGHTLPSLATLEKLARALGVPLYFLLYDGDAPPKDMSPRSGYEEGLFGNTRSEKSYVLKLRKAMGKLDAQNRKILMEFAQNLARRRK